MEIEREVLLDAPPEEVWEALTDPEQLEEWFANDVEFDLERGGVFRWDDGEVRHAAVEEVDAGRRLAIRWWDPAGPDESEVTFTLEEIPAGTRLVVTETASCDWAWGLQAMSLQGVNRWRLARRHAARCGVLGRLDSAAIEAPCVLASLGADDPGAQGHLLKSHAGRQRLLCAV